MNNVNIPKRQYHHGNLREALIKAGMRAVAEHGPDGFSLREVATRAGVTPPAVYRHFKDKDELLAAVAAESAERLAATVNEALAAETGNSLARFRAVGIAYVQFAVAHPEHFRALSVPGLLRRLTGDKRAEVDAWSLQQRADIEAGQAAGEIADIPIDELLLAANATVHGLAHLIVEGQLGPVDAKRGKQLAIALTGALGVGFIPRDAPPTDPMRPGLKRKH
ncbi:MAG TPA: TetR/AcrR family transcriptional regulator [Kofleriaceae bacterium]